MNFHGGQFQQKEIIDFSVNIPNLAFPDGFEDVIRNALLQIKKYPDIEGAAAKSAIAEYNNICADHIVLGNGATELIYLMSRAIAIKKATIIQPTFTEYNRALVQNKVEVNYYHLDHHNGFELDPNDLIHHLNKSDSDLLVLCNPNNPTGNLIDMDVIEYVLESVENKRMMLMLDESFMDFVSDYQYEHHAKKINTLIKKHLVVVIRSLTKNFMIPGIRSGYAIGSKTISDAMNGLKEPWSINTLALTCIPFLMQQNNYLENLRTWCQEEMLYVTSELNAIRPITAFKGSANFILFRLDEGSPQKFMASIIDGGAYIRPCDDFEGLDHRYFRIALRNREENTQLIKLIMEAIQ